MIFYQAYFVCFERRGRSNTLQSFTFFFGIAMVLEVALILVAGVDLTSVNAAYIGKSLRLGIITMPYRLIIPFVIGSVVGARHVAVPDAARIWASRSAPSRTTPTR